MLDTSIMDSALVFRDSRGRQVARGVTGVRYIFPGDWVVQHAPELPTHSGRTRWIMHWRKLPELDSWSWLDDIITTKQEACHDLRMVKIPVPRPRPTVVNPPLQEQQRLEYINNLLPDHADKLRGYLKHMRQYGDLRWTQRVGYGFLVNAGGKWVSYDRRRSPQLTSNLGW